MDRWDDDLRAMQIQLPCWLAAMLRPRLILLPQWWPTRLGAWIYFHFIFIGPGLPLAPQEVRRYLLGHEYGHVFGGHVVLHYLYWFGVAAALAAMAVQAPILELVAYLQLAGISVWAFWPALVRRREYEADAIAARLCGREAALRGALWLAGRCGTINSPVKQDRLRRLGWRG